jgi:hypothetical protein
MKQVIQKQVQHVFLDTCSTNLTCAMGTISSSYLILTSLGTTMVPKEKTFVANMRFSSSSNIP